MLKKCSLLVHYKSIKSPVEFTNRIIEYWKNMSRKDLFIFSNSGPGLEPTSKIISEKLAIINDNASYLVLKESRKKETEKIQLYFTDPAWKLEKLYFCNIDCIKKTTCYAGGSKKLIAIIVI